MSTESHAVLTAATAELGLANPKRAQPSHVDAPMAGMRLRDGYLENSGVPRLPQAVAGILRERGVMGGPVLLLTEGSPAARGIAPVADPALCNYRLSVGAVSHAPALLNGGNFSAIVLALEGPAAQAADSILTTLAERLRPDMLLVLVLPNPHQGGTRKPVGGPVDEGADRRESTHLMLLRCGYERVWVHGHRTQLCVSARRAAAATQPRICSIIVPVFNEKATFAQLMRMLLAKRLDHLGLEREILIVESHSTDGSRELVAGFEGTPGVRILWQDRPRGKGHAVREALKAARGDIVLIQDADLEYDVNDYDALLEPLLRDRAAFVLGSRHNPGVRMRRFTDQRLLGSLLDAGHVFFTTLINVLYGQRLKDPFTMFKVFRRDCLYGLPLECNRFDFDHELVIKLVLKGYRPLEIPVNYSSRSFKQGKKIRVIRDALTWIVADVKYRLQPLRPRLD